MLAPHFELLDLILFSLLQNTEHMKAIVQIISGQMSKERFSGLNFSWAFVGFQLEFQFQFHYSPVKSQVKVWERKVPKSQGFWHPPPELRFIYTSFSSTYIHRHFQISPCVIWGTDSNISKSWHCQNGVWTPVSCFNWVQWLEDYFVPGVILSE